MAYTRIWRFEAAPGRDAEFVGAYGPDGDWVQLFRRDSGYVATEFVQPVPTENVFLIIDRWASRQAWENFLAAHREAYAELDRRFAALCQTETELDEYETP